MDRIGWKELFKGFEDREMEHQYLISLQNPKELRIIMVFGILFYLLFLVIDYILFSEYFCSFIVIRCAIFLPVMAVIFSLSYTPFYEKHSRLLISTIVFVAAAGIIAMVYITRESEYAELYYYGVSIIIIFFYGTGKITLSFSIIIGLFVYIPAVIVDILFIQNDFARIITRVIYLLLMVLAGSVTTGVIQRTSRSNFLKQKRIEELSMTDPLTGLKNRLFFETIIRNELTDYIRTPENLDRPPEARQHDRDPESCYALIMLDIDYFKIINDKYGHDTGDLFLREFCDRVKEVIRTDDVFIRWGGEEFLLILRHARKKFIARLSNRISAAVSAPFRLKNNEISATVSGGLLIVPPKSVKSVQSIDNMIELADKALYYSKNNGRNRFTENVIQTEASGQQSSSMKSVINET